MHNFESEIRMILADLEVISSDNSSLLDYSIENTHKAEEANHHL
jgi:hypothetical protein